VARILKSIMGVKQLPLDLETSIPTETEAFVPHLSPAAFYHTWNREEIPQKFREILSSAGFPQAIAVSALVATAGSEPEEYLSDLLMNGETSRSQLVTALGEECAELSFNFILKLLADDAKADDCEISEPLPVTDGPMLAELLGMFDGDQDVTIDAAYHLSPRFTRVGLAAWWPVAKKKRSTLTLKKKSA